MSLPASPGISLAEIERTVEHRPWPLLRDPWMMTQRWENLLFAHWPLRADTLRPLVPAMLELDTYEGQVWVGVVPFDITVFRPRMLPLMPLMSAFLELNVRTYVKFNGKPGVYFFSLDAASLAAVVGARIWFNLPYFEARMTLQHKDGQIHYTSHRLRRAYSGAPPADFGAAYQPTGDVMRAEAGSLAAWLTERYCLYAVAHQQKVYCGEIHHVPWPLQTAEATIVVNTMTLPPGIRLPDIPPLLHFARRLDVLLWPPYQVR
jgi:uncharacterized protein